MNIAIVVQRYGADISGGAELHARYVAEHLSRHAEIRVLTTCARDYVTWRNELPAGLDTVNDIPVERFPVARERDPWDFGQHSARVFDAWHSVANELEWLNSQGPQSPGLIERLRSSPDEFDHVVFFCARYWQSYHGVRAVPRRAVLVPTAERDAALGVAIFGPIFRGARAIMYNSYEERAAVQAVSSNHEVPGVVVGVGSEIPVSVDPSRFRQKFDVKGPFVIYVGRIDANKGCAELFEYFTRYAEGRRHPPMLLLVGAALMEIPKHPRIRHLGYLGGQDKAEAIAASEALLMPSYYESLSMVALEAWALGRPVLANAHCDVLAGQCLRSNAGLYYGNVQEFSAALERVLSDRGLAAALGRNGRAYYERHYAWPVIEQKYMDMFARIEGSRTERRLESLPGWWRRHRATLPPAADVVRRLPCGPVTHP
jgi:glycosyltransferase involved in cell wall biosynthesis